MKLNPKAFGLACGAIWGVVMFIVTILNVLNGYALDFLFVFTSIYPGYAITYFGSIIGALYGFIDGFLGGWLFAWLYNRFNKE